MLHVFYITFKYLKHLNIYITFKYFLEFICLFWERESQREREREIESQAGSMPSAQSPTRGSNSLTVRSWPEQRSKIRCLIYWATQEPLYYRFLTINMHWGISQQSSLSDLPKHLFCSFLLLSSIQIIDYGYLCV